MAQTRYFCGAAVNPLPYCNGPAGYFFGSKSSAAELMQ